MESTVDAELLDRGGVGLAVQGRRATITLENPDKLNAQTPWTWSALREIGEKLDPQVRVVVVAGRGRAFSAGLDRAMFEFADVEGASGFAALAQQSTEQADAEIAQFQQGFSWLRDPDRVTIAAVQGHAIGAGFQLALACDMRVLAEDAKFRMAETGLGLVPDLGGTLPLVRAVGYAKAAEICIAGHQVGAEEALRLGLANRVVAHDQLSTAVDELAEAVLTPPDGAVRETLSLLVNAGEPVDPEQQLAAERAAQLRRISDLVAG